MASQEPSEYNRKRFNRVFYSPTHDRRRRPKGERIKEELMRELRGEAGLGDLERKQPPAKSLDKVLKTLITALDVDEQSEMRALVDAWPQLAGPEVAAHCQPRRVVRGVLQVEVASAAQRYALQAHRRRLVHALQEFSGGKIRDMYFVAGGQSASSQAPRRQYKPPSKRG